MLATAHWYTSTGFLTLAGIGATLLAGGVGALITYLVSVPRRQLLYSLQSSTSLLTASPDARKDIKVFHIDKELKDPHVIKVSLTSRSRSDIPSDAFDQDRPIILDVGVPIIARLPGDAAADSYSAVDFQGTALRVGPDLITKRQRMNFNVLVDGNNVLLKCEAHLVNVKVREQPPNSESNRLSLGVFSALVVASGFIAFADFGTPSGTSVSSLISIVIAVTIGVAAATIWVTSLFRR